MPMIIALLVVATGLVWAGDRAVVRPSAGHGGTPVRAAGSEAALAAPLLGYLAGAGGAAIRPIVGIPGAAILGAGFPAPPGTSILRVSPRHDYLIAESLEDQRIFVLRLLAGRFEAEPCAEAPPGAEGIFLSPSGSAAAFYYPDAGRLQVITGLPGAPRADRSIDVSALGSPAAAALNDEASAILYAAPQDASALYLLGTDQGPRLLSNFAAVSALSFSADGASAAIADRGQNAIFLLRDPVGAAEFQPLAGEAEGILAPDAVEFSRDGQTVVASSREGAVWALDILRGALAMLRCPCAPAALHRVAGNSVFRLTNPSDGTVYVFDGDADEPRIVFLPGVPPVDAEPATESALSSGRAPQ